MSLDELEVIRKIKFGNFSSLQLEEIFGNYCGNYRIKFHLVQHPKFPVRDSLSIVTSLFSVDLVRVIKNPKVNPFIRKKAENEFLQRYGKIPLGEKYSFLLQLPESVLKQLTFERDRKCLHKILQNPKCTETVIINFVTLAPQKKGFYSELINTKWFKRKAVINSILEDNQAPVKILSAIIPQLTETEILKLYKSVKIHQSVKKNIEFFRAAKDKNSGYS